MLPLSFRIEYGSRWSEKIAMIPGGELQSHICPHSYHVFSSTCPGLGFNQLSWSWNIYSQIGSTGNYKPQATGPHLLSTRHTHTPYRDLFPLVLSLQVGEACRESGDLHSAWSVVTGLQLFPVARLTATWSDICRNFPVIYRYELIQTTMRPVVFTELEDQQSWLTLQICCEESTKTR